MRPERFSDLHLEWVTGVIGVWLPVFTSGIKGWTPGAELVILQTELCSQEEITFKYKSRRNFISSAFLSKMSTGPTTLPSDLVAGRWGRWVGGGGGRSGPWADLTALGRETARELGQIDTEVQRRRYEVEGGRSERGPVEKSGFGLI